MNIEEMKKVKEERGYSFDVLSAYSGVPKVTLVRIFDGTTKKPRTATLQAIERVLDGDEYQFPGKRLHFGLSKYTPEYNVLLRPELSRIFWMAERAADPYGFKGVTADEFLNTHTEERTELIDGRVVVMEDPLFIHSEIAQYVFLEFHEYIRKKHKKCRPVISGTNVILRREFEEDSVVCPDFFVVCDRKKIVKKGVAGAPDFVLEVTSPSNMKRDYYDKPKIYMNAGVREYWVINPQKRNVRCYLQDEEGMDTVHLLGGTLGVHIFDGELQIDLDEISRMIDEDELREEGELPERRI